VLREKWPRAFPVQHQDVRPLATNAARQVVPRQWAGRFWAFHKTDRSFMEVEISLAHRVGGNVHEAHRRRDLSERRAVLMASWGDYLDRGIAADAAKKHVIAMQACA
jgi:hypothetical protein